MGTKTDKGNYDCYESALPDEPMFILVGRDPDFYRLVSMWAERRMIDIKNGDRPREDVHKVTEARQCAIDGAGWRRENMGKWRIPTKES